MWVGPPKPARIVAQHYRHRRASIAVGLISADKFMWRLHAIIRAAIHRVRMRYKFGTFSGVLFITSIL